jgi:hypothetical protein
MSQYKYFQITKKNMVNEIKEGMLTMFHQIENINKETEITKKKKTREFLEYNAIAKSTTQKSIGRLNSGS